MSPAEAAKILDLPVDASPEQLEARFQELRTKLEEKIGKAPTPGLKAKYRESLDEITVAFETLTLAADSSSLPVANKTATVGSPLAATSPVRSAQAPTLHSKPKSGGKEFALVTAIAVAVLATGGWWIMKTRAENAEKTRIAAEQKAEVEQKAAAEKAETDRKAEQIRLAAEAQRKADAEEKVRVEKLTASLLAELAESKVTWEAFEDEQRNADRRLGDLKSDLRNVVPAKRAQTEALIAAQEEYLDWLKKTLSRHPAKVARARAEQLLSARQPDEARGAVVDVTAALAQLEEAVASSQRELLAITGSLSLNTEPSELEWMVTDAFGARRTGRTPAKVSDIGIGPAEIVFLRPGWADKKMTVQIARNRTTPVSAEFAPGILEIASTPSGAEVWSKAALIGVTPLTLSVHPGRHEFQLNLKKYEVATASLSALEGQTTRANVSLVKRKPLFLASNDLNPLWSTQISSGEFQADLVRKLRAYPFKVSLRLPGLEENVLLEVSLQRIDTPDPGLSMTAHARTHWILRYAADGTQLWSQAITGTHTAGVADAVLGSKRMQLVSEGSVQAAVATGVAVISRLRVE